VPDGVLQDEGTDRSVCATLFHTPSPVIVFPAFPMFK